MPDTATEVERATSGVYRRLTDEAVARAEALASTDEARAYRMGISRSTYMRMLRGKTDTPLSVATKVAKALGLTVDTAFADLEP